MIRNNQVPLSDMIEIKAQAAAMFVHFSKMLVKEIIDSEGRYVGRVCDFSAKLGDIYPRIEELIISKGFFSRTYSSVPWSVVVGIEDDVVLSIKADTLQFNPQAKEYEFLLRRDILDQQVVDTHNHKVRRVNDVHLLKVERDLFVAHVDIGWSSLIRRLDLERPANALMRLLGKSSDLFTGEELVSWKFVQPVAVNPASMTMKLSVPQKQIQSIPAADLGDIIFDLNIAQRMALFKTFDLKTKARIFESIEPEEQKVMAKELDKRELAQIVGSMPSDAATDLLERLPASSVKNLLTLVETTRAKKLSALLGYSSDSAGGLMTTEFVSLAETMTVEAAIAHIRGQTRDVEMAPYIYIVDEKNRLKGVTTVRRLLFEDGKESVLKTVFPKTVYVYLNNSVKEVAYLMDKYKILSIPVIDEAKTLHGVIEIDAVLSQVISIAWRRRPRTTKGL